VTQNSASNTVEVLPVKVDRFDRLRDVLDVDDRYDSAGSGSGVHLKYLLKDSH